MTVVTPPAPVKKSLLVDLSAAAKSTLLILVVLAVLAGAAVTATVSHTLTGSDVYNIVLVITGGTALAGGLAIAPPATSVVPHAILILAIIGLTVALALENVFGATEVQGIFAVILGSGTVGVGVGANTSSATGITATVKQTEPAPEPPAV